MRDFEFTRMRLQEGEAKDAQRSRRRLSRALAWLRRAGMEG
jgi:hypothetical protein